MAIELNTVGINKITIGGVEVPVHLDSTETVTVGSGGDFATINAALAYATKKYPVYVSATVRPRVTINLLTGFVMAEQVIVDGQDLSWITISSVGAEVTITRSALTTANAAGRFPAFTAQNGGFTPIINVLFNMDASGTSTNRDGLMAFNNSRAIILSDKGFKNVGGVGIYAARGSTINAHGANASGATIDGITAERASTINAESANASGAGVVGIYAIRSSTINAQGSNAQRGGSPGTNDFVVFDGSIISAQGRTGGTSQTVNTLTINGIIFG